MNNKKQQLDCLEWIDEYLNDARFGLRGKILLEEVSPYQRITIFESILYGKGLLLDGCWMTTELQEKHYHECLVHPALTSAKEIKKILIIGGGDGGTARECLRYESLEHIDMVEIDGLVVELSQKHLPLIGGSAWNDHRLNIHIQDGINWVDKAATNSYDVVIVDGSDPTGPAQGLFNKQFFEQCSRILRPGGIFATQSESPEAFKQVHIAIIRTLREVFNFADPLYGSVPIYPSGWWSWSFASAKEPRYLNPLLHRVQEISAKCEVWSARWQKGAFEAIPAFIERELKA